MGKIYGTLKGISRTGRHEDQASAFDVLIHITSYKEATMVETAD